jgi:TonB-dependent starch-binding outer membrane protein SusC
MKKPVLRSHPNTRSTPLKLWLLPLFALLVSAAVQAQTIVKGKVTDDSNAAVPGVSVLLKGSTSGTMTDANGDYSLSIPSDAAGPVLVFSFIGYTTQEVPVQGKTSLDVKMASNVKELEEVVVVGYGTQLKRDITGAIIKVNSDVLMQTASVNAMDQLKGHAAGVDIQSNSAVPGGGYQIRIRGNRSMTASSGSNSTSGNPASAASADASQNDQLNQPLLVVDGIPYNGNLNDISPNDIASLEILKDASATAIYGSRGSGGVILVTTKRGQKGKAVVSYSGYYGVSKIMGELKVFNGPEYAAFKAAAQAGNNGTTAYPLTTAENAALAAGVSTDWQKLIYQPAPFQNHNITVSGGGETSRYSVSGGYFQQGGIIPNQNYNRYTLRSTVDEKVGKRVRLGLNSINTYSIQNTPGGSGVPSGLMRLTPLASPYNPDGTVNLLPQVGSTDATAVSPLTLKTKGDAILASSTKLRTFNSLYGEVDIAKGLKYRGNVGLDYSNQLDEAYAGPSTYVNVSTQQSQSQAGQRNTEFLQYTVENLLMYEKTFNEKHKLGVTGLYSFQKQHQQGSGIFGTGVPADYIQAKNISLAQTVNAINPQNNTDNPNFSSDRGLISYMARATYSYENRFSATATVRTDGASVLSPGNQYFTYPAFAGAWNISNENFMDKFSFISNLKLRAGWGVTSNQGIQPYATLGALSPFYYNFGVGSNGVNSLAYLVTQLPNHSLKWQSTKQSNFGLDFGFLKNRITGALEIYGTHTDNILLPIALPPSNGATSTVTNIGSSKTHGLELSLNTINIQSDKGFVWSTELNYFFNREKILSLSSPGQTSDIGNGWFVGQPMSVIYDYKKIGIWQSTDNLAAQTSPVPLAGQIKVQDINSPANDHKPDGKITPDDRQILGNFQPKFDAGMTNRFTFKGFEFSFSMYARVGMKVVVPYVSGDPNGSSSGYSFFMQGRNNQLKVDYWTPTNPTNKFPQPNAGIGAPLYSSTLSYVDGSFLKMRTINFGYNIPQSKLGKSGITNLRVYVSAVNPFVIWSPFVKQGYGPDPEGNGYGGAVNSQGTSNTGSPGRQVSVNANNPSTRQFILGVNLQF